MGASSESNPGTSTYFINVSARHDDARSHAAAAARSEADAAHNEADAARSDADAARREATELRDRVDALEADGRGDRLESSVADWLEAYRNKLLEGRFEYMDGDGCVETMASAPSRGK